MSCNQGLVSNCKIVGRKLIIIGQSNTTETDISSGISSTRAGKFCLFFTTKFPKLGKVLMCRIWLICICEMNRLTLANSILDDQVLWAELGARLTKMFPSWQEDTQKLMAVYNNNAVGRAGLSSWNRIFQAESGPQTQAQRGVKMHGVFRGLLHRFKEAAVKSRDKGRS